MRFEYLDSSVPMTVIGGHMGRFTAATLGNAIHYLDRLQDAVVRIRADAPLQLAQSIFALDAALVTQAGNA